ncbi:MAG: class I SAM-dependent methyltransferase, partial [Eubacteriales bacterium]|nr:class I SAM-dependent methyltransferase [Eubacteriales bacterium]
MDKIVLTQEKETLLIPLFGKSKESHKPTPVLFDKKAVEILNRIDYDFASLKIPEKTNIMMCIRAKMMDGFAKDFLAEKTDCAALHLGCGLDSRYARIENHTVDWYDVDFEEVIALRRHFYKETATYHLVASSVTQPEW